MRPWIGCVVACVVACVASNAHAVVLYDGNLGTTPAAQGWLFLDDPLFASNATLTAGPTFSTLDTTTTRTDSAGLFGNLHPGIGTLDRTAGFELIMDLRIDSEGHDHVDRGGFSVIFIANDLRGLETAFWTDEVWVYEDDDGGLSPGDLFTHAEGAFIDTTQTIVRYTWTVQGAAYSLAANGSTILTGSLRDYTGFMGAPDPYEIPNFIFFGDDTSSADASVEIARVELNPLPNNNAPGVPEPASAVTALIGLALFAGRRRRVG